MTTQEYIDKIKAIAQGARAFHETHGVTVGVLNPSWLRKVPLAQFVELCDTFPHDPAKCDTWPLAWLKVDGIDICMWGADKVPQAPPPPPQPSSLDYLRAIVNDKAQTDQPGQQATTTDPCQQTPQ